MKVLGFNVVVFGAVTWGGLELTLKIVLLVVSIVLTVIQIYKALWGKKKQGKKHG